MCETVGLTVGARVTHSVTSPLLVSGRLKRSMARQCQKELRKCPICICCYVTFSRIVYTGTSYMVSSLQVLHVCVCVCLDVYECVCVCMCKVCVSVCE